MNEKLIDLTTGNPGRVLGRFMLPILFSYVLQQVYVLADTVIVGRGIGVEALAAVGTTDMLRGFVLWGVMGLTEGFGVVITLAYGKKNKAELQGNVRGALFLMISVSVLLFAAGAVLTAPLLKLIRVPAEIVPQADLYMRIMVMGSFAPVLYNTGAVVLRAFGNSRTPFTGILISSVVNIALDLLFVYGFGTGIGGAAAATVIAQLLSGLYVMSAVRRIPEVDFTCRLKDKDPARIRELLRKGIPNALQNSLITVGGTVFQMVINSFGLYYVAAFTAVSKLYLLLEGAAIAMKGALISFVGQNAGAGYYDRVRRGLRAALLFSAAVTVVIGGFLLWDGRNVLMLFVSADPKTQGEILEIACHFLRNMCLMMFALCILDLYRGTTMGMGNTLLSMWSGFAELTGRLAVGLLMTRFMGAQALFYAEPAAWICADLVVIPGHYLMMRHREKQ